MKVYAEDYTVRGLSGWITLNLVLIKLSAPLNLLSINSIKVRIVKVVLISAILYIFQHKCIRIAFNWCYQT